MFQDDDQDMVMRSCRSAYDLLQAPVNVGLRFAGMLYKEMIAPGA